MNTYVVEISKSTPLCWYAGLEGTRFEVYQGRRIYMIKSDYDKSQDDPLSVRGIEFKDCEKVCTTCGHIKSQHNTAGGFCKHCPCAKFTRRRTKRAPDAGDSAASTNILQASAESALEGNTPPAPAQVA